MAKSATSHATDIAVERRRSREADAWVTSFAVGLGAVIGALAVARWALLIWTYRNQGLDPSDESYYLTNALSPDASVSRISDFGFYTHLLLQVSGGAIGGLRVSALLVLLSGSSAASWSVARWLPPSLSRRQRAGAQAATWSVITAVTLSHYVIWLVTPSYNLLGLAFGLFVFAGLLCGLAVVQGDPERRGWRPIAGFVVMGAFGVLLADIKATSGLAAGALCAASLVLICGPRKGLWLMRSIALGLVVGLIVNLFVVGSPLTTLDELVRGRHSVELLQAYTRHRVFETTFLRSEAWPWSRWFLLAGLSIGVAWRFVRSPLARITAMTVASMAVSVQMWVDRPSGGFQVLGSAGGWWWFRATAWSILFVTALASARSRLLAIGPLLAFGCWAITIGTDNGFIRQGVLAAGLFSLAIVAQTVFVSRDPASRPLIVLPGLIMCAMLAATSLTQASGAVEAPYRLDGPVSASNVTIDLSPFGNVDVSPAMAEYISQLQSIAPKVPDDARNCLVDLSGGTPVSALALRARSATANWVIGGYSGSADVLAYELQFAPCINGQVLLIEAPAGPTSIPMPASLRSRVSHMIGEADFNGYNTEKQIVSVLDPPQP